jgi:tetratricopeptide (TPR) repeat protein
MIVRNGAEGLERCLRSVAGIVDRIVIGDTGSNDDTIAIARRYGAEVISVDWRDDFGEARNQVLSRASCDWVLVLDADEMLESTAHSDLLLLLRNQGIWAYDIWRWNYVRERGFRSGGGQAIVNPGTLELTRAYPACFRTDHTRLFRRDPRIRFEHCVHESVLDSLEAAGLPRGRAGFVIHHFGYVDDDAAARARKDELYHRLTMRKLAAAPTLYEPHLEAGIAEIDHCKSPERALAHFDQAAVLDPLQPTVWLCRGICQTRLHRYPEALQDLQQAELLDRGNPLVHSSLGDVHFHCARYAEALAEYERARALGDASPLTWAKMGAAEVQLGRGAEGLLKVQEAAAEEPDSGELLDILATTALLAGQPSVACNAASRRLLLEGTTGFHFLLAASVHQHAGDLSQAEAILQAGLMRFPNDPQMQSMAKGSAVTAPNSE